MARYTELNRSDVDEIAAAYALPVQQVSPLAAGAANSSFLLCADDRRYVLTVLDNHDRESALRLVALLDHLNAHGIPTSRPLHTRFGAALTSYAEWPVMVKEYIPGACDQQLPANALGAAGTLLGQVHAVPAPDWLPSYGRRLPPNWSREAEVFKDRVFVSWLREQYDRAAPILNLDGPTGLVHGDYFADNLVVGDGGGLFVLDWETAAHDLLVLDLGMAVVGLCRENGVLQPDRAAELVTAYEVRRPLTMSERRMLFRAVLYASIVIAYHRYRRHHLTHPDSAKQHLYQEIPDFVSSLSRRGGLAGISGM